MHGVERGYGSARARTEQSRERGEDPGRRKGKDLTRGPGLSVGDATSAGCGLSGELGSGSGPDAGSGEGVAGRSRLGPGREREEWAAERVGPRFSELGLGCFGLVSSLGFWAGWQGFGLVSHA